MWSHCAGSLVLNCNNRMKFFSDQNSVSNENSSTGDCKNHSNTCWLVKWLGNRNWSLKIARFTYQTHSLLCIPTSYDVNYIYLIHISILIFQLTSLLEVMERFGSLWVLDLIFNFFMNFIFSIIIKILTLLKFSSFQKSHFSDT